MSSVCEASIQEVVTSVWSSTLGMPAMGLMESPPACEGQRQLVGCVQITGAWNGAVTLHCTDVLARRSTAAMFGAEEGKVSGDEIRDAMGELTNQIGGNIKALLDGACQLSLPSVAEGKEFTFSIPGTHEIQRQYFVCDDCVFMVRVLERN
jgi:chemotaxis protein CheX